MLTEHYWVNSTITKLILLQKLLLVGKRINIASVNIIGEILQKSLFHK